MAFLWYMQIFAFSLCFGSFAWAMYGGFFRSGKLTKSVLALRTVSALCLTVQAFVLLTADATRTPLGLLLSILLYLASLMLFWVAVYACRYHAPCHCFINHQPECLIDNGPFRLIRHPFYVAYTLAWLAGVFAANQAWLLLTVVVMVMFYWKAAVKEEHEFENSGFAKNYQDYRQETGMFIPRISRLFTPRQSLITQDNQDLASTDKQEP